VIADRRARHGTARRDPAVEGIYRRRAGCAELLPATKYQLDERSGRWTPPPQGIESLLIEESSLFPIVVFRILFPFGAGKESDPDFPQVQTPVGLPVLRGGYTRGNGREDPFPLLIWRRGLELCSVADMPFRVANLQDTPAVQVYGEASDDAAARLRRWPGAGLALLTCCGITRDFTLRLEPCSLSLGQENNVNQGNDISLRKS
jgi:hypothetical protein